MISDATCEDEIYSAFMLYASLHGIETCEEEVRRRVASYLANNPDDLLDQAIVAFQEDRVLAPPDVILPQWGKSRVYELWNSADGRTRHKVNEAWFEAGCRFDDVDNDSTLLHFWTLFQCDDFQDQPKQYRQPRGLSDLLATGVRLQLRVAAEAVEVWHRGHGRLGCLPSALAREIMSRQACNLRYLPLVDGLYEHAAASECKLLVIVAGASIPTSAVVDHAAAAFIAERVKC